MHDQKSFEQFLELCRETYERMDRDRTWPWRDSQISENLVESEDQQNTYE